MKKRTHKTQNIITLVLTLAIITLVNLLSSFVFTRFDLTADKRYTLSEPTKKILANLTDLVFFKVYLEGDFPPGFRRMRNETKELLDEMRIYAKGNLEYEFIDPSANPNQTEREALYRQLTQKGLYPTTLETQTKEGTQQMYIFPGAVITYKTADHSLLLLKDQLGADQETMINNSIRNLEYELIRTIKNITTIVPPQICFLTGHGELGSKRTADIYNTIAPYCGVFRDSINGRINALDNFDLVIIAKPDSAFNEKDKFILDQYIMRGGKVLWFIDQMDVTMDSLASNDQTFATPKQLNLDDMLFRYGVRINYDLIADLQAVPIPVKTGNYTGNQPEIKRLPWFFFPLLFPTSLHPVVNNLNAVKTEFVSSIDTVGSAGITKTVLLSSSRYTSVRNSPVMVSLEMLHKKPDYRMFSQSYKPVAVLLEGSFTSNFKNRLPAAITQSSEIKFTEQSKPTKMIVISDGDVIKNDYRKSSDMVMPLGYDRYNNQFFGNKDLILNMIDYLTSDSGLLTLRSKQVKLRLLDRNLIAADSTYWKTVNVLIPVLLIVIAGIVKVRIRKRKYAA